MVRVYQEAAVSVSIKLSMLDCASCGMVYAITQEFERRRRSDGQSFWCPNGHSQTYGETDVDRERKMRQAAEKAAQDAVRKALIARQDAEAFLAMAAKRAAERDEARTELRRVKRRANAGVCQECHRSFADVRRHVSAKHPAAAAEAGVREPDPRPKQKRGFFRAGEG